MRENDLFDLGLSLARAAFAPDRPLDPPEDRPERDFGDRCDEAYAEHVARELESVND